MRSATLAVLILLGAAFPFLAAEEAPATQGETAPVDARALIPTGDKLKAAEAIIRDIFKDELKKTAPQDQINLAAKFVEQAKGTTDDPAARYKLLEMALSKSSHNGDIQGTLLAIQALQENYQIDCGKLKLTALTDIGHSARSKEQSLALAKAYVDAANGALPDDDYATASSALAAAQPLARAAQDVPLFTSIEKQISEVNSRKAAFDRMKSARSTLVTKADDPDANLTVGKYFCLIRGEWDTGLPMLVKGSDPKFADAATTDYTTLQDAGGQVTAGDKWYDLCAQLLPAEQDAVRARAAHWYTTALPSLTGLSHSKVEKRIEELQRGLTGKSSSPGSKGNPINLLALIDPKDASQGTWTNNDGGLVSNGAGWARIQIPYQPPDEYDLRVSFTRTGGKSCVFLVLANPHHQFLYAMGDWDNTIFGFEVIKKAWDNENPTTLKRGLETGRKHSCVIKVRKESISVLFDEISVLDYKTDFSDWSMDPAWSLHDNRALGVGSRGSPTIFHSIEVVEISGPGTTLVSTKSANEHVPAKGHPRD